MELVVLVVDKHERERERGSLKSQENDVLIEEIDASNRG